MKKKLPESQKIHQQVQTSIGISTKLLYRNKVKCGIPSIIDGEKVYSSTESKANLFNKHFSEKSKLPDTLPELPEFSYATNARLDHIHVDTAETKKDLVIFFLHMGVWNALYVLCTLSSHCQCKARSQQLRVVSMILKITHCHLGGKIQDYSSSELPCTNNNVLGGLDGFHYVNAIVKPMSLQVMTGCLYYNVN